MYLLSSAEIKRALNKERCLTFTRIVFLIRTLNNFRVLSLFLVMIGGPVFVYWLGGGSDELPYPFPHDLIFLPVTDFFSYTVNMLFVLWSAATVVTNLLNFAVIFFACQLLCVNQLFDTLIEITKNMPPIMETVSFDAWTEYVVTLLVAIRE